MKILVINSWSQSLKYQLYDNIEIIAKWQIERIWNDDAILSYQKLNNEKVKIILPISNHSEALQKIFDKITNIEDWVLNNINEIEAIWHRVVHGWEYFHTPVIIDNNTIKIIEELSDLAPLHNPANVMWIKICKELLNVPQVAVFDTSFHQSMGPESFLYSIPTKYYDTYKLRRYGFHGISHQYISETISDILSNKNLKIISCHVWNWASVCAINNWKSVATSMWFTPLEGLMMWTRSGDIDAWAVLFLMEKEWLSPKEMNNILNKESGVTWLSWYSWDLRPIEDWHIENLDKETMIMNIYINQIAKYIWAYYVLLWWCDVITFTAWVLENSPYMRRLLVEKLNCLGIYLDEKINDCRGRQICITTTDSKLPIWVIPTDEELIISKSVISLLW